MTTFLLAEDDANDVSLMQHEFDNSPYNAALRVVPDGSEAIKYMEGRDGYQDRDKYPVPDVILLDLKMPKVGGFEFLEWLRSKSPNKQRLIPVVVMSSSALPEDVARAYELGANSYMTKPVGWSEFHERIKSLGRYWTEHVATPDAG